MKNSLKKKEGITLIALVITIIVLLILAGVAISMLSGENGILKQAAKASEGTNKVNVEESLELAVLSAKTSGLGKIDYDTLNEELAKLGFKRGENNENDIEYLPADIEINDKHYYINKDGNANTVKWYYKKDENGRKTIITNGEVELPIGTYVNYDATTSDINKTKKIEETYESPTGTYVATHVKASDYEMQRGSGYSDAQNFSNSAVTDGWRVLGIDEEKGEVLLVSGNNVMTTDGGGYNLRGFTGYQYGIIELNNICQIFGYGYGATGARSIIVEDINKITGYNPNNTGKYDPDQIGNGEKSYANTPSEYGTETTYSWDGEGNLYYKVSNGMDGNITSLTRRIQLLY